MFRARALETISIEVAQRLEHQANNLTVAGSTPVVRNKLAENQPGRESVHQVAGGQQLFELIRLFEQRNTKGFQML